MTETGMPPMPGPLNILVVDDEIAARMTATVLLQRRGHKVTEAADGANAMVAIREAEPPFDAVLLDWQMPGMDGSVVLASIRSLEDPQRAGAAVIVLTARTDEALSAELIGLGADEVLAKPFRWEKLAPLLQRCVDASAGLPGSPVPLSPIECLLVDLPFEQVRHLLERATVNLIAYRKGIEAAAAAGNGGEVERLAHKIVGVAGTYGCTNLKDTASAIERAAAATDPANLPTLVVALGADFDNGLAELERLAKR